MLRSRARGRRLEGMLAETQDTESFFREPTTTPKPRRDPKVGFRGPGVTFQLCSPMLRGLSLRLLIHEIGVRAGARAGVDQLGSVGPIQLTAYFSYGLRAKIRVYIFK